ncbi:hypothetical protein E3N88_16693 [Mikania micrantha]|uniref:Uncharacterized protein n=1 Tax=Mikania micrantha TaxID=192012 RepID=A0A5N6NST0_9ASTR|nr:hypothetical protein E3N88_16693 [Mikania micrantha]
MIVFEKYERFASKQLDWAYWAHPRPIAVRDGHPIGLSRYAKLERENLNSPKTIAVRDDRSTSTIAVRGVFREQNDYFNHRAISKTFLKSIEGLKLKNTIPSYCS